MKKILLVILTISASFVFNTASAQGCGGLATCNAGPSTQTGFPYPDSIPCAPQGVAYDYTIPFKIYSVFHFAGNHHIDSITIDTIYNLPGGLCYQLSKSSGT